MRVGSWMTALALTACSPLDLACGGARPELDACATGLFHADCGGDGAPVLACHEVRAECRWFTGGCVAREYRPIECPSDDVCCVSAAAGTWPYEDGWSPSGPDCGDFTEELAVVRASGPITPSSPATIAVTIDPSVPAAEYPMAECAGIALELCVGPVRGGATSRRAHDTFVLAFHSGLSGEDLAVEIVAQEDGSLLARGFLRAFTDLCGETPLACESARTRPIELGGTLVIDQLTDDTALSHGVLELSEPAGATIRVVF